MLLICVTEWVTIYRQNTDFHLKITFMAKFELESLIVQGCW